MHLRQAMVLLRHKLLQQQMGRLRMRPDVLTLVRLLHCWTLRQSCRPEPMCS
jgi:hypothetical protein